MNEYTCTDCGRTFKRSGSRTRITCGWCGGVAMTPDERARNPEPLPTASDFTTKHHRALAKVLRDAGPHAGRRMIASALAEVLEADNPRFDRDRFLEEVHS